MLKSMTFEVVGEQRLHCEACQELVERLLKGVQGVSKVRAQAHTQRIEVLFDTNALDSAAISKRLAEAGYETTAPGTPPGPVERKVETQGGFAQGGLAQVELVIPSMVCEGCAEKISTELKSLPGVRKVKANVRKKRISIDYEPGRVQKEQFQEALIKVGYSPEA